VVYNESLESIISAGKELSALIKKQSGNPGSDEDDEVDIESTGSYVYNYIIYVTLLIVIIFPLFV